MFDFDSYIRLLREDPKTIVLPEGTDPRVIEAASRLLAGNFLQPILIGEEDAVWEAAQEAGYNIRGAKILTPSTYEKMDEMVEQFCEIRAKKGMTQEKAKEILKDPNYFGTMLIKMGEYDSLLGGVMHSVIDTIKPALEIIGTKEGNNLVSSCIGLVRPRATGDSEVIVLGDCALNIKPTEDELVEIAHETANCARDFGIDPKIAFLSYSTHGSGKGPDVDRMCNAANKFAEKYPHMESIGEVQFDAAVSPTVAATKCPGSEIAGHTNTFIFPDLSAGNIGYKIARYLGNFEAFGPILLGLNAPINTLSRECSASEVYHMSILTAAMLGHRDHSKDS